MEYLKVDPQFRRKPKARKAGWVAREVYLFLLQLAGDFDCHGRIPSSMQDPEWLAEEWGLLQDADVFACKPADLIARGIESGVESGLLHRDGAELVISGWDDFYRAKTNAERQADHRKRKPTGTTQEVTERNGSNASVTERYGSVTRNASNGSNATPLHSTPLHKEDLSSVCTDNPAEKAQEGPKPEDLQALWNSTANPSLPRWRELTDKRRRHAKARLQERPLSEWRAVIERISRSAFCLGETSNWRASPDWLLQADTAAKVLEGKYDNRATGPPGRAQKPANPLLSEAELDALYATAPRLNGKP